MGIKLRSGFYKQKSGRILLEKQKIPYNAVFDIIAGVSTIRIMSKWNTLTHRLFLSDMYANISAGIGTIGIEGISDENSGFMSVSVSSNSNQAHNEQPMEFKSITGQENGVIALFFGGTISDGVVQVIGFLQEI